MTDGMQENRPLSVHLTGTEGQEKLQDQSLQQKVDAAIRKTADAQEKGRKQAEAYIKQYNELALLLRRPVMPSAPTPLRLDDGGIDDSAEAKKRFEGEQQRYVKDLATYQSDLKSYEDNRAMRSTKLQQIGKDIAAIGMPALEPLLDEYLSLDPMLSSNDPLRGYQEIITTICNNNPRSGAFERVFLRRADLSDDPVDGLLLGSLIRNVESGLQNQVVLGFITGEAWEHIYPPLTGAIAKEFNDFAQGKTAAERKAMEMRIREYLYHFRGENQQERGWPLVSSMLFRRPAPREPMEFLMSGSGFIAQAGGPAVTNALIAQESDKQRAARRNADAAQQRKFERQMTDWRNQQQPFTAERGLLALMQQSDWGQLQSRLDQIINQVAGKHSRENLRDIAVTQAPRLLTDQTHREEFTNTGMKTVMQRLSSPDIDPAEETALIALLHAVNPSSLNEVMNQRTAIRLEQAFDLIENGGLYRDTAANAALWRQIGPVVLRAVRTGGALGRRAVLYAAELKAAESSSVVIIPKQDWEVIQKSFESMRVSADLDDRLTAIQVLAMGYNQETIKTLIDMLQRQTGATPLEERIACAEACASKGLSASQAEIVLRAIRALLEPLSGPQLGVTGAAGSIVSLSLLSATDRHRLHMGMVHLLDRVSDEQRRQILTQLFSVREGEASRALQRTVITNVELRGQNRRLMESIRRGGYASREFVMELIQRPGEDNAYTASQAVRYLAGITFIIQGGSGAFVIAPEHLDTVRTLITRYRNLPEPGSPEDTPDMFLLRSALQEALVQAHSAEVVLRPGDTGENTKILQDLRKQITDLGIKAPPPPVEE